LNANSFRFLGPISDVAEHLAAADIFLLTSRWEALPISIVEAFRAGLPVIATDCGGVSELVDDAVGALVPVGNEDALTSALDELIQNEKKRTALAAAALARSIESRFDTETIHRRFEALYEELLKTEKNP